jgi:glycosyltransferase involved in cell wall biosynthesis
VREPGPYDHPPLGRAVKRFAVRSLAAIGGAGLVVTTRDLVLREREVREALDAATRLVAPTRVLAEAFERSGVPPAKLTQLCYSIDARPYEAARSEPEGDLVRIGYTGQFTPQKGLGTLMRAARIMEHRLPESVEPWELVLYGTPAGGRNRLFAEQVLRDDREVPVAGRPRVTVQKPFPSADAPEVLAGLTAIAVPSEWDENAPLTCLQARAAGVPIVASDVRGISEVVEHGVHGLLVPPGDPAALADALRTVVLRRFGRTGRSDLPIAIEEHVERVVRLYIDAVESVR